MITATIVLLIVMLIMSGVTLAAFSWAASDGQFEDPQRAAEVIFDEDERIGEPTDPAIPPELCHEESD